MNFEEKNTKQNAMPTEFVSSEESFGLPPENLSSVESIGDSYPVNLTDSAIPAKTGIQNNKNKTTEEYSNLPKGWQKVKLGNVCEIDKKTLSSKTPNDYCFDYISLSDIDRGTLLHKKKYNFLEAPSRARRVVKKGDVLLATVRPNLQGFYVFKEDIKDYIVSTGFAVLTPKPDVLDSGYLFHTLFSSQMLMTYHIFNVGSNYPALNSIDIHKFKIPLPPLREQRRIVGVLSTWDQAIEKLDKLILAKEKHFKWLLQKLIYNQKNNPEWEKVKLEATLSYEQPTNYIVHSTQYNNHYNTPVLTAGKTFIIGYTNEKDGIFPIQKLPVIIFDDFTTAKQFVDFPFKVKSSAMKILLPKKETIDMKFIFYSMKNINFQIKSHKRFWISQYSKIKIPIPRPSKQKKITKILFECEKEIKILKQLSNKYQSQKRGLMQKLLTGKVRLQ